MKERAILRRERRVFLDWGPYVASKFLPLFAVTVMQMLLMWSLVGYARGLPGELGWQLAGLVLASANGVAFGLIISAFAASSDSATGAVPLALLPQIVLAGVLLLMSDMNRPTWMIAQAMPSRWGYQMMEAAWLHERHIDAAALRDSDVAAAFANFYPDYDFKNAEKRKRFLDDHKDQVVDLTWVAPRAAGVLMLLCALQLVALTGILALRE